MVIHYINKMWRIDEALQLGNPISKEDIEFFNENFDDMAEEMNQDYLHWKHHTRKYE